MTELMQRTPLGEQLIAAGMLTEVQLELALREQARSHGRMGQILVQLGFVAPEGLADWKLYIAMLGGMTS